MTKTRLESFSDGVFSIAITLLILNVKIPDTENITNGQLNAFLLKALPDILTFFFTFLVVGVFWVAHHRIFAFVKTVDSSLLWINIVYLMFNALIPFPASILAKHPFLQTSILLYAGTLIIIGLLHFVFLGYIYKNPQLMNEVFNHDVFKAAAKLSVIGPICYLMAALTSFIHVYISFVFILSALVFYIFFAGRSKVNHRHAIHQRAD